MINVFSTRKGNTTVLMSLLRSLKVKVTSASAYSCLHEHPDYPSLLSFSDCLKGWKVPNVAYHIDAAEYNSEDLSFPLLAHLTGERHSFIVIENILNGEVSYIDERNNKAKISESVFLQQWDGIVIYPETTHESGEKGYRQLQAKAMLKAARVPLLLLLSGFLVALFLLKQNFDWFYTSITLTTVTGMIVSVLLLLHSVNADNPLIQNLCSLGKKDGCNAVLKSDSSKITDWLSWSEIGFFYFSGFLLSLLLVPTSIPALTMLNIICLPYTVWSIWYQFKLKNWCILCCSVQAILWMQFVFLFSNREFNFQSFDIWTVCELIACFLSPILIWSYLKPVVIKAEQLSPLKKQVNQFKYNVELFNQLLSKQPKVDIPDDLMPIILGNASAPVQITMVSNPYCGPCAKAHQWLDEWLEVRDDIRLNVIFTGSDTDEIKSKTSKHLAALGITKDKSIVAAALNEWYKSPVKDYDTWAKSYPVVNVDELEEVTRIQRKWCDITNVTYTPTILINGYRLPEPYRLEDLKYFLN